MILFVAIFLGLASWPLGVQTRSLKRTVMMHVVEEVVNGVLFTQRTDTLDGTCREVWAIDGKAVPEAEYLQAMVHAEVQELQRLRQQEQQRISEQQQFRSEERRVGK